MDVLEPGPTPTGTRFKHLKPVPIRVGTDFKFVMKTYVFCTFLERKIGTHFKSLKRVYPPGLSPFQKFETYNCAGKTNGYSTPSWTILWKTADYVLGSE